MALPVCYRFFPELRVLFARIDADRTGAHRAERWFEPSGSIAFMRQFFPHSLE